MRWGGMVEEVTHERVVASLNPTDHETCEFSSKW